MCDIYFKIISPIDGRYKNKTKCLKNIFSEFGLIKKRIQIELYWFKKLSYIYEIQELPKFNKNMLFILNNIINNIKYKHIKKIRFFEKKIKHDVKSIEYFIKNKLNKIHDFKKIIEFIHFACTSEDINNLAYALMLKKTKKKILIPYFKKIIIYIKFLANLYKFIPILGRTHGQIATPTTMGKEMLNFYYRLKRQLKYFKNTPILGKINGSIGNYNVHLITYPNINWHKISEDFIKSLGLKWNPYTTQIEPHDYIVEFLNCIIRFNNILINFNRDIWHYISLDYFKQNNNIYEVGSSVMPHKINPINFENSEGNLGISNALMIHMSNKLPISRLQRDLSDSTVLRNLGVTIGYSIIAYDSLLLGLQKIQINTKKIFLELIQNWQILSEPIQTMMRKYNYIKSYEYIKNITKGKKLNKKKIFKIINNLNIPKKEKKQLKLLTPINYIGLAIELVNNII